MKSFTKIVETNEGVVLVVDALNLGFRYMHSKAQNFATDYMRTVESFKKSYKCDKVVILADWGSSSYRKGIYPEYKANRAEKFKDQTDQEKEDFEAFFEEMQTIYDTYATTPGYLIIRLKGVEADDIAAYICSKIKHLGLEHIWLISTDRDWNLLISEQVSQFSYVTRKEFTEDNWSTHYPFPKEDYISIKCLMGDTGDNVLGVPGIGPKRAQQLVQDYGSTLDIASALPISSKYKYIAALNEFGADNLMLNYRLMDLVTFCEEAIGEDNCKLIDQMLMEYLN